MEPTLLAGLNAAQRAAVTSTAPVLQVLAPPGSGKTKTLTTRVAYLLAHHGYAPQNVICCTFTIKAAREMRERLRGLVGELEQKLVLGTFHSICRRYLVAYGNLIGIPKGFGIADTSDQKSIVKRIVKRLGLNIEAKAALSRISSHKSRGKTLDDLKLPTQLKDPVKLRDTQEFQTVFHEYQAALTASNLLDYDDLLLRCVDLLRSHGQCVANVEALLIDEYQDTNVVQFELMKLLARGKRRITIVGDPDQSIYSFRAAEIENLKRMKAYYPDTVVINLEENYRSSSAVLNLAQEVIEQDSDRPEKKLKSTHCYGTLPVLRRLPNQHEEALWLASEIKRTLAMTGGLVRHSDIAVLLRSGFLSLLIEKAFTSSGIPYRMVGGTRFFDRVEIRIIIDYLRVISHPDNDAALLAIINTPSRKIGDATIGASIKLGQEKDLSLWQVVQKVLAGNLTPEKKPTKPSYEDLHKLVNLIKTGRQKMKTTQPAIVPSKLIEFIVSAINLQSYLQKKYKDDHEDRIENITELITHAAEVATMTPVDEQLPVIDGAVQQESEGGQEALDQFLANIVLSSEVENADKGDETPRVTISTIHSAKGLEWPVVFVPAVYEGSIPHSRAENTDEERRLLYVAMTRAQALLTLSFPVLQKGRDSAESILTQFLPNNVLPRLGSQGPRFDDDVVSGIATILRRPMPSQEELVKGRQTLGDKESAEDDLWPTDGSPRQMTFEFNLPPTDFMPSTINFIGTGRTLDDALKGPGFGQRANYSTMANSTTMSSASSFSAANTSMGFTAASQLRFQAPSQAAPQACAKPVLAQNQTKPTKPTIASFFQGSGTWSQPLDLENRMSSKAANSRLLNEVPLPPMPAISSLPSLPASIPDALSTHRIGTQIPRISALPNSALKRPRAALEPTSPNNSKQKKYVFLSSSPPPEAKDDTTKNNEDSVPNITTGLHVVSQPGTAVYAKPPGLFKQHSTGGMHNSKKTLGMRRVMNGWDARKNK